MTSAFDPYYKWLGIAPERNVSMGLSRGSPRDAQAATGRGRAHLGREFFDRLHGVFPLFSGGERGIPRISESFF